MRLAYANEESKYFLAERKKKPYNFDVRKLYIFEHPSMNDLYKFKIEFLFTSILYRPKFC